MAGMYLNKSVPTLKQGTNIAYSVEVDLLKLTATFKCQCINSSSTLFDVNPIECGDVLKRAESSYQSENCWPLAINFLCRHSMYARSLVHFSR